MQTLLCVQREFKIWKKLPTLDVGELYNLFYVSFQGISQEIFYRRLSMLMCFILFYDKKKIDFEIKCNEFYFYLPRNPSTFHIVSKSHIVRPYIKLPFSKSEYTTMNPIFKKIWIILFSAFNWHSMFTFQCEYQLSYLHSLQ